MEQGQVGNNPKVAANCFIDSTSYREYFIGSDFTQKLVAIRPYDQPKGGHEFRASSAYKYDFGSDLHNAAASGKQLIETIKEQRRVAKKVRVHQRAG